MANKQQLTVAEAAILSGKSAHALRRALRSGVLRGSEVQGGKTVEWRISRADLEHWQAGYAPDGSVRAEAVIAALGIPRGSLYYYIAELGLTTREIGGKIHLYAKSAKRLAGHLRKRGKAGGVRADFDEFKS